MGRIGTVAEEAERIREWIDTAILYHVRDGLPLEEAAHKAFTDCRMPTIVDYCEETA